MTPLEFQYHIEASCKNNTRFRPIFFARKDGDTVDLGYRIDVDMHDRRKTLSLMESTVSTPGFLFWMNSLEGKCFQEEHKKAISSAIKLFLLKSLCLRKCQHFP
jgi:hypothetical protein